MNNELLEKIEQLEKELAEVKAKMKESEELLWMPGDKETYFTIDSYGIVTTCSSYDPQYTEGAASFGNIFKDAAGVFLMNLETMRKIAEARTKDDWRAHFYLSDWETPAIITEDGGQLCKMSHYGKMREDAEFIAMAANTYDKLLAVAEAAKELFVEDYLFVVERQFSKSYLKAKITPLFKAIEELERE